VIESTLSPSLQKLILTLSNLGLTGREIAETVWLALQAESEDIIIIDVEVEPPLSEEISPKGRDNPEPQAMDLNDNAAQSQAEIVPPPVEKTSSLALPPNYKPIAVPDAPAISQALLLARALRPLARQIEFGLPTILDELATVNYIAETGIWQPVLKPESELWLDVALVFDTSPSMCLWQRLGTDIYRLLSHYGEFRDVRIWFLRHTAGKVDLTSRHGGACRPTELLTGDRRRLIVIVSDCIAPAWHNGNMRELIAKWSAKLPTVVFQVFPERLWSRTALARSTIVEFQAKQVGIPSNDLKPFVRSVWDLERLQASLRRSSVRLPVVTLEKDALANWARMVVGDRRARTLGIVWDDQPTASLTSTKISSLKDRIDSFLLMSSPISRDLASLLASSPVITLPIMRLIKQSMLPHANAVHMAEVFMSGLLQVSGSQSPTFDNAERIAYELVDEEVRDRLRAGSLVVSAFDVFEKVSRFVAKGLGRSVNDFWALLRTSGQGKSSAETEFLNAFASVSSRILRGLGDEFEAIANSLAPPSLEAANLNEQDYFPLEDLEYEVAKFIDFPPLQVCECESATITAILDRFDFETAQIKQQSALLGLRSKWKIDRRSAVAWGYTELLNDEKEAGLDMIAIPGGSFKIGDELQSPGSQHDVTLQPFYLGRYLITQAQWRVVAGYEVINIELPIDPSEFKGDNLPVENIRWADAQEFCQRISVKTGKNYRLPSEAEWEYACRAGTVTPFYFGETISSELANYDGSKTYNNGPKGEYREETTKGGVFPANDWGLHDMHGNLWEWCKDDWHEGYDGTPRDGSAWVDLGRSNSRKLVRGGSWGDNPGNCRSASRYDSYVINFDVGVRVVCEPPRILLST
jgi:formylglycine-generating enzyme required for sulfatase activity